MSCSRLIGSIILSFFLFTSLVANNIVPKDVKIEENTEATAGEGTFSNDGEGSILGTSPKIDGSGTNLGQNRPEKTGAYNKDAATNPMSAVNTDKNPSDVISGKDASEVFNKGEQSRVDLVPQENGITNGAVKSKTGEILRKEGDVIKAPASELNSLGIDGGILKAKEGEILRKEGDVIKASNLSLIHI